jgi:Family of unknown function (DUF5313)
MRAAGTPGPIRWIRYAIGFRLPEENRDWVRHDLTDAGWWPRLMGRHLTLVVPVCVLLALLPAAWSIRVSVAALLFLSSTFVVAVASPDLRVSRLRQHGLPIPNDPERGHPSH